MPSSEQHVFQAKHNQELLDFLVSSDKRDYFRDWYVTIAFYTALHHFEAILHVVSPAVNKGRSLRSIPLDVDYYDHDKRLLIMRDEVFRDIYRPYFALYSFSRLAKYNCQEITVHTRLQVEKKLIEVVTECLKIKNKYA